MIAEYYNWCVNEVIHPYVAQRIERAIAKQPQMRGAVIADTPAKQKKITHLCELLGGVFDGLTIHFKTIWALRQAQIMCGCDPQLLNVALNLS